MNCYVASCFNFLWEGDLIIHSLRSPITFSYHSRTTIFTEHSVLTASFKDAGIPDFPKLVSYNHFRIAWYLFLELISAEINFSDGFLCSQCGTYPSVTIMDATSLAFRRDLDFWSGNPLTETDLTKANVIPKGR